MSGGVRVGEGVRFLRAAGRLAKKPTYLPTTQPGVPALCPLPPGLLDVNVKANSFWEVAAPTQCPNMSVLFLAI